MSAGDTGPKCLLVITCGESGAPGTAPDPNHAETAPIDHELARVIDAWPDLSGHIKAAVLALIGITR